MRLSFITLFLACLSLTALAKPQFLSRRDQKRTPIPNVLKSRQHLAPHDLLDICINTDVNLLADAAQLLGLESILGPLDLFTSIHLCLCLKVRYMRFHHAYTQPQKGSSNFPGYQR